jgi:hypothetical protein
VDASLRVRCARPGTPPGRRLLRVTLPLLEASANIALAVVAIAGALAAAVYTLSGTLSMAPLRATAAAGTHLAVLAALALAAFACRLILITYSLEISRDPSSGAQAFPAPTTSTCGFGSRSCNCLGC